MHTKVLVLDIDGTLTNSDKIITEKTREGILGIEERGHKVILASGRPTPGMKDLSVELELERYGGYLLSFNGGRIINCKTGEIVYQRTLPPSVIPGLYHFAVTHDCGLLTYLGDEIIAGTRIDEYMEKESRINHMNMRQVSNFAKFVDFDVNKLLMTADPDRAAIYEKELNEKYGDILSVYRSAEFFIEIMPKNVDKAASLDRMLESVGLTREDTICCGDGFNDISMIKYAGVGVAIACFQLCLMCSRFLRILGFIKVNFRSLYVNRFCNL